VENQTNTDDTCRDLLLQQIETIRESLRIKSEQEFHRETEKYRLALQAISGNHHPIQETLPATSQVESPQVESPSPGLFDATTTNVFSHHAAASLLPLVQRRKTYKEFAPFEEDILVRAEQLIRTECSTSTMMLRKVFHWGTDAALACLHQLVPRGVVRELRESNIGKCTTTNFDRSPVFEIVPLPTPGTRTVNPEHRYTGRSHIDDVLLEEVLRVVRLLKKATTSQVTDKVRVPAKTSPKGVPPKMLSVCDQTAKKALDIHKERGNIILVPKNRKSRKLVWAPTPEPAVEQTTPLATPAPATVPIQTPPPEPALPGSTSPTLYHTVEGLLKALEPRGFSFKLNGNQGLSVKGPVGSLTESDRASIMTLKDALISRLRGLTTHNASMVPSS